MEPILDPNTLAEAALTLDELYLQSLPFQVRFECSECGRAHMSAAVRRRKVAKQAKEKA